MCNYCEPHGWENKCCCICGAGSKCFISISIHSPNNENLFPYTTTDLCESCYKKYGIESAFEHNKELTPNFPPASAWTEPEGLLTMLVNPTTEIR